jgi:hypothetical protein
MNFKLIAIISVFLVSSCASFINKIDDDLLTQKSIPYKKTLNKKTYCEQEPDFTLISESKDSQRRFKNFIKDYKFNYADKLVLWTFVQMNLRPDLSGPNSKLQIFLKYNGRQNYFHFFSKDEKVNYPLLFGLEQILKQYHSRYNLSELADIFDSKYPNRFYVSQEFAVFLDKNIKEISLNKNLRRYFTRADEPLREGERIYKQKITPFIKLYLKSKKNTKYVKSDYLFEYKRNNLIQARCNYDMSLYSSSIYLINDNLIKSNMFGMRIKNDLFLSATTQSLKKIKSLHNSIYFQSGLTTESAAMCSFESKLSKNKNILLASSNSRDPGQHLYHIIEYGLQDLTDIKKLDNLLKFSRHLFLKNPVRLILESQRSSENQLEELLKLNMPIYNSEKLGKIWGYLNIKNKQNFIIDDRRIGELSCKKSR